MTEDRYLPDVRRRYEGAGVVVNWEPALCIHVGNCFRALPTVFEPGARPWVKPDAASRDEVIDAVLACPTGALSLEGVEAGESGATTIEPRRNGPVYVRGIVEVVDRDGNVVRRATRLALCRCGESGNKPYCDLSHQGAGFTA
jgi:uncharacterized Fe-S cluster protein YjdI